MVALREAAGLNQTDFGARIGMNQAKVSRLETAHQVPTEAEAAAWADTAGADPAARERVVELARTVLREPVELAEYVGKGTTYRQRQIGAQERSVSVIRGVQIALVPGLLQTADYTRRQASLVDALSPEPAPDSAATLVAWAERREVLYEPGRRFESVVTEGALRWRPGPDDAPHMPVAQLHHHLLSLATLPTVRIRSRRLGAHGHQDRRHRAPRPGRRRGLPTAVGPARRRRPVRRRSRRCQLTRRTSRTTTAVMTYQMTAATP